MAAGRRTMRELKEEKHAEQVAAMEEAIADGSLTVRQMTPAEQTESDLHRAAGDRARAKRAAARRRP